MKASKINAINAIKQYKINKRRAFIEAKAKANRARRSLIKAKQGLPFGEWFKYVGMRAEMGAAKMEQNSVIRRHQHPAKLRLNAHMAKYGRV